MENVTFNVPSLGCGSCSRKIQDTLYNVSGIEYLSVDLKSQQINVEFDPAQIQPGAIKRIIAEMGFDVF